ncbi:MAG: NAD-dependent SIR2 family protein deacetylase [Sulfurimonas sp.]|jgi:NAD-dependent SIR2 family protein deacetylase|uniref:SIR2 family NAD-dependent protein deacylase n=1 Tax=Sulfurimonas sp. TaxID=2022749 RepID=UPI0039E2A167
MYNQTNETNETIVIITAGAGMALDSGLPDFRSSNGLWNKEEFTELSQPSSFSTYPEKVWGMYGYRLNMHKETVPHDGFKLLLDYVKDKDYFIFTSNVDGQFQKAGFDSEKITESHGNIHYLQCTGCSREIFNEYPLEIDVNVEMQASSYPLCEECGSVLRPNILMFNDYDFNRNRVHEQQGRMFQFIDKIRVKKIVIIEIGAGTDIPSIRSFSETMSQLPNSILYRINPSESEIPDDDGVSITLGALEGIKKVLNDLS